MHWRPAVTLWLLLAAALGAPAAAAAAPRVEVTLFGEALCPYT
jgi:hypothetical protein